MVAEKVGKSSPSKAALKLDKIRTSTNNHFKVLEQTKGKQQIEEH